MDIKIENIKGLDNIIKHKKKPVPQSSHPDFPVNLFFTYCSFGMKNSGKTYSIVKLLSLFEQYPVKDVNGETMENRIIWFSPTSNFSSNSIVHTLKSLDVDEDIYENVTEAVIEEVFNAVRAEKEMLLKKDDYIDAYKRFLKIKDPMRLKIHDVVTLSEYNFEPPSKIFGHLKNKCYFFILDDLIGQKDAVLGAKKNSFISNLVIKHRHYGINLIFTSQEIKYIPPIIRSNLDIIQLFKTSSNRNLEKYYEEVSNILTFEEFEQLFKYCTEQPYGSLIINNHQSAKRRFWLNWDKALSVNGKS
jgi:hypothetical protein